MAATLIVLIAGVVIMGKGGEGSAKTSNKLMIMRVVMQLLAVVALVVVALLS